jgi:NAD(P)-dependent dehydrogenase (short-subunit alcohol dehydrogenase family)
MTTRVRPRDDQFQMPSFRLDGQVALVTGGSRGLGLGVALALAHHGADIALAARTPSQLDEAAELVRKAGRRAITIEADVSNVDSVKAMTAKAQEGLGRIDILVNGAGINIRRPADTFTEAEFDQVMDVNLKSAFFTSIEVGRLMRAQKHGRIINIGSLTFEFAVPNVTLYAMSKGGMKQLTKQLALEWAKDGVTVNAIAPGRFWTALTDAVFSVPELYDSAVSVIPLGRPGLSTDLAGAAVLLASPAGSYITGQTIYIDGGWLVNSGVRA